MNLKLKIKNLFRPKRIKHKHKFLVIKDVMVIYKWRKFKTAEEMFSSMSECDYFKDWTCNFQMKHYSPFYLGQIIVVEEIFDGNELRHVEIGGEGRDFSKVINLNTLDENRLQYYEVFDNIHDAIECSKVITGEKKPNIDYDEKIVIINGCTSGYGYSIGDIVIINEHGIDVKTGMNLNNMKNLYLIHFFEVKNMFQAKAYSNELKNKRF